MNDLLATAPFHDVKDYLGTIASKLQEGGLIHLQASADLECILALAHLEAALLDSGIKYQRRLLPAKKFIPHDEQDPISLPEQGLLVHIDAFEDTWELNELEEREYIHLTPLAVNVRMGSKKTSRRGGLDVCSQCSALAAILAPNGTRTRRMRPHAGSGLWLREALDTTFDPIHTFIRDHLKKEGSIRVAPLPEVVSPASGMIPNLAERMLSRLSKGWSKMDFEARAQALSELTLPTLTDPTLSTPRLEELIWQRIILSNSDVDLASQLFLGQKEWPDSVDECKLHASILLDKLITTGLLV